MAEGARLSIITISRTVVHLRIPSRQEGVVKQIRKNVLILVIAWLALAASTFAAPIRVTTWNLEWFPNGSKKERPPEEQQRRIAAAADVLRPLNSDIILLQ